MPARRLFALNLGLVWAYVLLFLRRETDHQMLAIALPVSAAIVGVQTPLLLRAGPLGRLGILYASMVVFLFILGVSMSWDFPVGSEPAGSWLGRLDAGVRIAVLGQMFGLPGFMVIAIANYFLFRRLSPRKDAPRL